MVQDLGRPGYAGRLADDAVTIADVLSSGGYRCFLSGKWHLGTADPTRHGFEEFYGTIASARNYWDPEFFVRLPAQRTRPDFDDKLFYGTDALTDQALDFLAAAEGTPDRPWFLYLAFNAPHFPLQAPAEDIARYADVYRQGWDAIRTRRMQRMKELGLVPPQTELPPRSRWWNYGETETGENRAWDSLPEDRRADLARRMAIYAAMIDRMDGNIGRVVERLTERGQFDNTLILFLSDNGACAEWDPRGFDGKSSNNNRLHRGAELERMGGPGTYHSVGSGWANASNTPWRLYKHYNHEGGIRSPCIVHWPAHFDHKGVVHNAPLHLVDVLPTCLEAAGVEYPQTHQGRAVAPAAGVSALPVLRNGAPPGRPLFFEHEGHRAVVEGNWKLVALRHSEWELYNLASDPTELNNLAADQPERTARMGQLWDRWAEQNQVTPLPNDYRVDYLKARSQER